MASNDPKQKKRRDQLTTIAQRILGDKPIPSPAQLIQLLKTEARRHIKDYNDAKAVVERLRREQKKAKSKEPSDNALIPNPSPTEQQAGIRTYGQLRHTRSHGR